MPRKTTLADANEALEMLLKAFNMEGKRALRYPPLDGDYTLDYNPTYGGVLVVKHRVVRRYDPDACISHVEAHSEFHPFGEMRVSLSEFVARVRFAIRVLEQASRDENARTLILKES